MVKAGQQLLASEGPLVECQKHQIFRVDAVWPDIQRPDVGVTMDEVQPQLLLEFLALHDASLGGAYVSVLERL